MRLTGSPETIGKGFQKGCRKEGRLEGQTPPDPKRRVCINAPDRLTRNCRQGISKGMQEGREAGRANGDRTRQGVAGTAVLVKLQAAATEHM